MTRSLLLATFLLGAAFAAGCSLGPAADTASEESANREARQMYRDACASCHGLNGTGNGPVAPALKSAPADLTRLAERNGGVYPRELVIRTIEGDDRVLSHGPREMPVWSSRFAPTGHGATAIASLHVRRQVELLASYIQSLQRHP